MYTYIHTYIHTYIDRQTDRQTYVHACIYTYMSYIHMCAFIASLCVFVHTYTFMSIAT